MRNWQVWVLDKTESSKLLETELVQSLWNGYGELLRLRLDTGSYILKRVDPPNDSEAASAQRKLRSYEVERTWYQQGARHCPPESRVARCLGAAPGLLLMEDLAASGFETCSHLGPKQIGSGLSWLAHFHARFLNNVPKGLWEQGGYWHLETRHQEWQAMPDGLLKEKASEFDQRLRSARFQTLIHGDAKPPNFCWNPSGQAAAVDFQYVGKGCGIRDVALFLDRSLGRERCLTEASDWLETYFSLVRELLPEGDEVEKEWRALFPVAWVDYCRYSLGWGSLSNLDPFSQRQLELALG